MPLQASILLLVKQNQRIEYTTRIKTQGYQNLIRINKEKGILIFGKNILRESKNVLVELLSKGEIDRIDEIK